MHRDFRAGYVVDTTYPETLSAILRHRMQHKAECVLPSEWLGNGVRVTAAEAVTLTEWLAGNRRAAPEVVGRLLRVGILR